MEHMRKVPELKSVMGWDSSVAPRAKVVARVRLGAPHAVVGSGFFSLSTTSSLEYCLLSSCLLIYGIKRAAVGPNVTFILKGGRRVEKVVLVPPVSSYQKSHPPPYNPSRLLTFH